MPTRQGDHEAQHHGTTQKKDFKDALTFFVWRVRRFLGRRRERERKKKEKIEKKVRGHVGFYRKATWLNLPRGQMDQHQPHKRRKEKHKSASECPSARRQTLIVKERNKRSGSSTLV